MPNDDDQNVPKSGQEPKWAVLARAVAMADTEDFVTLAKIAGLDPAKDFRFADLSGMTFVGDLAGCDFTGARLIGCDFSRTKFGGTIFGGTEINSAKANAVADQVNPLESRESDERWFFYSSDLVAIQRFRLAVQNAIQTAKFLSDTHLPIGAIFIDAPYAPQMVVVPPGTYLRGTSPTEMAALEKEYGKDYRRWVDTERPQDEVKISAPFAVSRFPVTFGEWDLAQNHPDWKKLSLRASHQLNDEGWGREQRPAINVSWNDAQGYVKWLSGITGRRYRLLSETEWEYCCRGGANTQGSFIDASSRLEALAWFSENSGRTTQPIGLKNANSFGLHDMLGNVWEWCQDEWHANYIDTPYDGTAMLSKNGGVQRVVRGGSLKSLPGFIRSALRGHDDRRVRANDLGFRVARTLNL